METRLRAVAGQRNILKLLVVRDLRLRYAGTALGWAWTVLEPLAMAGVFWFVFTIIISRQGMGEDPFILFLLTGMLPWNWFQGSLVGSCKALTSEAKIVRSAAVPREIWVVRVVLAKMVEFIFAMPVIIALALLYRHPVNWHLIYIPLVMVVQFALCFGLGLALAPIAVIKPDIVRVIKIILRLGFYLTPVLYSLSNLSENHRVPPVVGHIAAFNPMAPLITYYRTGFWEDQTLPLVFVLLCLVTTAVCVLGGLLVFRRLEGAILKEI
ncbi:MAG TPA: ABC transporter permease [Candidatus Nanopelagicales bacterium]|nr:ABC transporter permease [Candidatus Nanopelagicales bacterium]